MNSTDFLAWVGAAAWLSPLIPWTVRKFKRPNIKIFPGSIAELGFTSFGRIIN